jgi:glycerophosphoryl diester phosphodiesterase
MIRSSFVASLSLLLLACVSIEDPLVIAHRGASGYLPEHTLEAVTLAHRQGADFIEQDVVLSKDLVPVVLHDIHLETVSDVEQKFPDRKREDGRYYAFDFSLAELKTLKVHERESEPGKRVFPGRYQGKAHFTIATFEEEIELITELNRQFGKNIGFYPEIKSPAWHRKEGADISKIVLAMLRKHQLDDPQKPIYVQCFDFAETQRLRNELGAKVKLVQLIGENDWEESDTDYEALRTPVMLAKVAKVAQGIGPWIPQLVDLKTKQQTLLAQHARQAGLSIHPFTFRKDDLPLGVSVKQALDTLFKDIKVDGVFSDFPDVVIDYLNQ